MRHTASQPRASSDGSAYYILRLKDAPAAAYAGGVPGYAATSARVRHAAIFDVKVASSYAAYLDARQSSLLDSAARLLGRTLQARFRYRYALDGMSLKLTPAEAQRLAGLPDVAAVTPVQHFAPVVNIPASAGDTNASRAWIAAPGVWALPSNGADDEGEGVVLADLDTGINHANSSFAAKGPLDGYVAVDRNSVRLGVCDPNNAAQHALSTPLTCNNKLIGAYSYTHGANDHDSPEDSEGHGSHTASTVVGDFVSVTVNGSATALSGVAPHASVIAYDICDPVDQCGSDQSVAAVDQAIQDQATLQAKWGSRFKGMVLNYSIGGSNGSPYDDPVEMAFLSAVEAGIYVSVAGGNGGPGGDPTDLYAVQHLGPWVATMAAATHDGSFTPNLLENFSGGDTGGTRPGASMSGAGDTANFGPATLVYSGDFSDPVKSSCPGEPSGEGCPSSLGTTLNAQQCLYPFPIHSFSITQIVVCDRGTIALVDKAYNVMKGGARGMVIATTATSSQDLPVEPYVIPATLIDQTDGDSLRAWLAASGSPATTTASAQISGASLTTDVSQADQLAGFSSRGPNDSRFDSILKPDITAPGVSVLAAVGNPAYASGCASACPDQPESYDFLDGTSMATPHDTGAAALLKQAHPSWTPSEIKSALMLTAVTTGLIDQCTRLDSTGNCVAGTTPSPQVRGAGRIDVDAAERSGLVLDESGDRYAAADPAKGGDLTTLNLASLGNDVCAPTCSWTRTLKSAFTSADVTYTLSVSGFTSGLQVHVSPASFTLGHGQTRQIMVSADSGAVPVGHWAFAELDIATTDTGDGGAPIPAMHLPLAVRATVPAAHMALDTSSLDYTVTAGQSAADSFTIENGGQKSLSWALTSGSGCPGSGMQGMSFDKTSGSVAAGSSTTVTATFSAAKLGAGDYSGLVCLNGDASDHPQLSLKVTAKVAGSGGGGGGSLGLFGLASLFLAWWKRKAG